MPKGEGTRRGTAALARSRAAPVEGQARQHVYYKREDADAPKAIKDRNGDVALAQCRVCRQAECELEPTCPGPKIA